MQKKINTKGFATTELLVALAVVIVIGVVGGVVYHQDHKTKAATTSSQTSTKSSTQTKTSTTPPADPYAGWKTAALTYEKATFKYPSSWQISNTSQTESETGGTVTPGADTATATSPTGLIVSINTGEAGIGDSDGIDSVLPGAQPINTLGSSYYLDFYANVHVSATDAQGACVDKDATVATGVPYIPSKNIQLANVSGTSASSATDLICIKYQDAQGTAQAKPVSTFEQDASYNDAKLIIESLSY